MVEKKKRRPPEFLAVPFGEIYEWDKNPRHIEPSKLRQLANSVQKYGVFQNLTCWKEGDRYVTGGGNMRYRVLKDVLKWPRTKQLYISLNFPETEAEKIELSLLDNQSFGLYNELEVANLVRPHRKDIDMDMLSISIGPPLQLETISLDYDEELGELPIVPQSEGEGPHCRFPITGYLGLVGIGHYLCNVSRIYTDRLCEQLTRKFGENRQQMREGVSWASEVILEKLEEDAAAKEARKTKKEAQNAG